MRSHKKSDIEFLLRRIDEVRMGEYERMRAKAHLARAEAVADFLVAAAGALGRIFRRLVVRPIRRVTAGVG